MLTDSRKKNNRTNNYTYKPDSCFFPDHGKVEIVSENDKSH